jgi:hypothetical protein
LEIQIDENFISYLGVDEIREPNEVAERMNDLIINDNFIALVETEVKGRRVDRITNFKRK